MELLANFEKRKRLVWTVVGLLLVGGVGILDVLTGYELSFSLFYLLPISLATWFAGKRPGLLISIVSALVWSIADVLSAHPYSHPAICPGTRAFDSASS